MSREGVVRLLVGVLLAAVSLVAVTAQAETLSAGHEDLPGFLCPLH